MFNSDAIIASALNGIDEATQLHWVPLKASTEDMMVQVNEQEIVAKIVDLRPW